MTFLYMASTFLVMVVLVIGITLINNYEKMEGLEMALSEISHSLENQEEQDQPAPIDQDDAAQMVMAMEEENAKAQTEESTKEAVPEETEKPEEAPEETEKPEEAPEEAPEQAPESESAPESEPESAETALSQNVISVPESYTVQKGDTLLEISRKIYGQDNKIDEICSLNGITDINHILVGQKLLLP